MSDWFLIQEKKALTAAENMARDEYLWHVCHKKKAGFFRLYRWHNPTFSFGVSQRISRALDLDVVQHHHCSFVRRITGGKTVLHDQEMTYAVISSHDIFYRDHDLYRSYMLISQVLVNALHSLGINAYLSPGSPAHLKLSKSSHPCFSFPTPNELEVNGKKIVGSAQKRDKFALLQHGSIPVSMDYDLYAQATRTSSELLKNSMTTLSNESDKTVDHLSRALAESFKDFIRKPLEEYEFDTNDRDALQELIQKYHSREWNFRL